MIPLGDFVPLVCTAIPRFHAHAPNHQQEDLYTARSNHPVDDRSRPRFRKNNSPRASRLAASFRQRLDARANRPDDVHAEGR